MAPITLQNTLYLKAWSSRCGKGSKVSISVGSVVVREVIADAMRVIVERVVAAMVVVMVT